MLNCWCVTWPVGFKRLTFWLKLKVKQSHYRPGEAQRVAGGWGSQISRQVVSPMHQPPLSLRIWYFISVRGRVNPRAAVQLEGLCQWRIPMTPLKIEPATFRLVVQCLNQLQQQVVTAINLLKFFSASRKCGVLKSLILLPITQLKCMDPWHTANCKSMKCLQAYRSLSEMRWKSKDNLTSAHKCVQCTSHK